VAHGQLLQRYAQASPHSLLSLADPAVALHFPLSFPLDLQPQPHYDSTPSPLPLPHPPPPHLLPRPPLPHLLLLLPNVLRTLPHAQTLPLCSPNRLRPLPHHRWQHRVGARSPPPRVCSHCTGTVLTAPDRDIDASRSQPAVHTLPRPSFLTQAFLLLHRGESCSQQSFSFSSGVVPRRKRTDRTKRKQRGISQHPERIADSEGRKSAIALISGRWRLYGRRGREG
jgi:hypothetical protein